jgi:hypothetical protein
MAGINKRRKGKLAERKYRKQLESLGYLTEVKNYSRFASEDLYGIFDIMGIMGSALLLAQVKSNLSDFYKARKEVAAWKKENGIKHTCQVVLYEGIRDKQEQWRIEEI